MRSTEPLLGTRAQVSAVDETGAAIESAEIAAFDAAARMESIFTRFDPTSALSAYRRSGTTDVAELITVRDLALSWFELTGGAFHPATQRLTALWDRGELDDAVPPLDELDRVLSDLDPTAAPDLDLNGIAKGWIAEQAVGAALSPGAATAAWLNLGGDVVHRGAGSVVVGIEDPHRPYDNVAPLATVELSNDAVATSGGARRWWTIAGQKYSKVLDPRSGRPTDHVAAATIVAPTAAAADALATAALVLHPDETASLADANDCAAFLVLSDRSIVTSSPRFSRG